MPTDPNGTVGISTGRRWSIVVVSLLVTASAFIFINAFAFLIPPLQADHVLPALAARRKPATAGLIFPAVLCAVSAVLSFVAITDPPRKEWDEATEQERANPYRGSWVLRRIHVVSALLMVPQTVTVTFML